MHDENAPTWFERLIQAIFPNEPQNRAELLTMLRELEQRSIIDNHALNMIEGVLRVFETEVRDVMVPRAQMVILEHDSPLEVLLPLVVRSLHSRFPVMDREKDEVVGILLAKDLLAAYFNANQAFRLQELLRKPIVVPEGKRLDVMLRDFRVTHNHMAIVVDEYGSLSGLITIEDVLEEIVGDIEDEYDPNRVDQTYIKQEMAGVFLIHALTPIEHFNAYFKASLSDKEFDTIGGFIAHTLGHLPQKGERIVLEDTFKFTVIAADRRRVRLLRMETLSG